MKRLVLALLLAACALGCEVHHGFTAVSDAVVGNELRVLFADYTSYELVGTHTRSGGNLHYVLYRLDLDGRPRFRGRTWSAEAVPLPSDSLAQFTDPHLVAGSDQWVLQDYDWDRRQGSLMTYDPATRRISREQTLCPLTGFSSEFASDWQTCLFTPSYRFVLIREGTRAPARATLGGSIEPPKLQEMVIRCHDIALRWQLVSTPLLSDDLRCLVVRPDPTGPPRRPRPYQTPELGLDANEQGFFCERESLIIRPIALNRDGLRFITANSVDGQLKLVYVGAHEVLVTDADGRHELVFRIGGSPTLPGYSYSSSGFWPLLWDSAQARLILTDNSADVAVLDLRSGRIARLHGASDEQVRNAAQAD